MAAPHRIAIGRETAKDRALVAEGMCPEHGTPLDRRADCGWCAQCDVGYAVRAPINSALSPFSLRPFERDLWPETPGL